jgi:hypothetical protein
MRNDNETLNVEDTMNFKAKVAILLVAVMVSLAGFNLIASSPAVDMMKMGKKAGYKIIANVVAETESPRSHS